MNITEIHTFDIVVFKLKNLKLSRLKIHRCHQNVRHDVKIKICEFKIKIYIKGVF